jgi:type I restriction enzyme S subunit
MSSLVPEGWELSPLSSLADYKNGRAFKPSDWSKSGLPILRIAQINNPHKVKDYYDGNDIDDGHFITKGDLIFSWSATLKAEIWSHYDAVLNQHIFKVTEKVGTNRSYLQQLLDYAIPKLAESSHGSTMKHIKKGVLDEFFSPVPPLPEQKKIASILTSVDEVIENTQKQIDKLQDLKKATMNELLTKGIGHTEFKDSELGRIPKSWRLVPLSDHASRIRSKNGIGNTNVLTASAKDGLINQREYFNKSVASADISHYTLLRKGDFAYNKSYSHGYPVGVVRRLERYDCGVLSPLYICFSIESKECDETYLSYYFDSHRFERELNSVVQEGARAHGLLNIPVNDFFDRELLLPPLPEQNKIASILTSMDKTIEEKQSKLSQTQFLKKSLMQDLLTGKVRVTVN